MSSDQGKGKGKEVRVVTKQSIERQGASGGQTGGMIRQNAVVGVSEVLCSSMMIAKPHTESAVHHHGEQDTIIFASRGRGTVISDGGKTRHTLQPGDFALIPAYAEHQEANEGDEEVVWVIVRSGKTPVVENLEGWGQS